MNKVVKLASGYDWSLSRPEYLDTFEALSAEKLFNQRVLDEGLTARWRVGTAQVSGEHTETTLREKLIRWREEAILSVGGAKNGKENSRRV